MADVFEELLEGNRAYTERFELGELPRPPSLLLAVVSCMDARIDVHAVLGLDLGGAHIIRNAGGIVTDDVERSIFLSQTLLGTKHIAVIMHTDCGLKDDTSSLDAAIRDKVEVELPFELGGFMDLEQEVGRSIKRLKDSAFIPRRDSVRGFIYDVTTGRLDEVS